MATINELRLSFAEEQILKYYSGLVEKEIQEAVEIILFGSRARGDSDENSDLDIAVILDVPFVDKQMWDRLWDLKWNTLELLNAEEFPLSLTLITIDNLMSRDYGVEKTIRTWGKTVWKRKN